MSRHGSASDTTLHPAAATAVLAAGFAAMTAMGLLLRPLALGYRAQIGLATLALAVPGLVLLLAQPALRPGVLGRRRLAAPGAAVSGLLGAALWVGSIGLMEMQSLLAPPPAAYLELFRSIHKALAPSGPADALVSLLVIAALPALCEEFVVRGVFLPSLVRPLGERGAIVASALLFALIHMDPYRFLFTLAIGLVFGWLRLRAGSLWPPVIAHLTLNALTFAVAPFVDDPSQPYVPQPLLGIATLVVGTALAIPLLRLLRAHAPRSART
jgi:membrane protease YdiL (CAAX protease family)